jgi:molybdopterin converting factor subunit 1
MKIRLLYFAVLRDISGTAEEELELASGTRAVDVWSSLRSRFPKLAAYATVPMTAINEEYASPDTPLHEGDELAFIPPISGG